MNVFDSISDVDILFPEQSSIRQICFTDSPLQQFVIDGTNVFCTDNISSA